jgi:Helix-turn-helix domain
VSSIVAGTPDGQPVTELLTAEEAAALLNVTPRWVKAVGGPAGIIPSVKIGGKYRRYPKAALLSWVESQQTGWAAVMREPREPFPPPEDALMSGPASEPEDFWPQGRGSGWLAALYLESTESAEYVQPNDALSRSTRLRARVNATTTKAAEAADLDVDAVGNNDVGSPNEADHVDGDPFRGDLGFTQVDLPATDDAHQRHLPGRSPATLEFAATKDRNVDRAGFGRLLLRVAGGLRRPFHNEARLWQSISLSAS